MKYNVKKLIAVFMTTTLLAAASVNCMLVGAADLPHTGGVPYNEEKAEFILDGNDTEHPAPEVIMGIAVGEDVPPGPTPGEYDLTLDWGAMKLLYTFTTDAQGAITGGSWGESFDGTNNQIKITNNSTTKEIQGSMTYVNTSSLDAPNMSPYSGAIKLAAVYDSSTNTYDDCYTSQQYTLAMSGNATGKPNSVSYYIYDGEDLYTKVNAGEITAPTESIAEVKVGMITVEAGYRM